jgi:hypothetical protein
LFPALSEGSAPPACVPQTRSATSTEEVPK